MNLQGILFFDRMTEEVLDSIRAELQVSRSMHNIYEISQENIHIEIYFRFDFYLRHGLIFHATFDTWRDMVQFVTPFGQR